MGQVSMHDARSTWLKLISSQIILKSASQTRKLIYAMPWEAFCNRRFFTRHGNIKSTKICFNIYIHKVLILLDKLKQNGEKKLLALTGFQMVHCKVGPHDFGDYSCPRGFR